MDYFNQFPADFYSESEGRFNSVFVLTFLIEILSRKKLKNKKYWIKIPLKAIKIANIPLKGATTLSIITITTTTLSITTFSIANRDTQHNDIWHNGKELTNCYAECHYAERHYAECRKLSLAAE